MSAAAMVTVSHGSRTFRSGRRQVVALDDVNLSVAEGEKFGVVGESGSGKTTLMRVIAGLERLDSGTVEVAGTDITALSEAALRPLRRRLQVVFQDPMGSLDPRMRIADVVAEPLVAQGISDRRADRVVQALEQVGLTANVRQRYPHEFSGGQRQRISLARALVTDPDILIADEAVSALDVTVRAQILDLIDAIAARRSLTLIFVSHDLSVIRRVCDRVAVLRAGRVVETGATQAVYDDPQHPYTRELLAAVPRLDRSLQLARARPSNAHEPR
ncbi:ABC transporter ATP-binding protein [Nakamurella aerolata]|uniref:ABC transporter ATP-binding protein n=1 Tax=Nakamurella aerolata TaxID=1656892 RepID=A0A849A5P6_9ACTN|nr:ABC transporter ATP-binding protein [Nakamurella aerolata]NNG34341.1 ABC transporter ATP-binding protein [Nakamurella aerolata]